MEPPKLENAYIANAWWFCTDNNITVLQSGADGAIIEISHYFSGTVIIQCEYRYTYWYAALKGPHSKTSSKSYYISCISGTANLSTTSVEISVDVSYKLTSTRSKQYGTPTWKSYNEGIAINKNRVP